MSMIRYLNLLLLPVSEATWQEQATTSMHQIFARIQDLEIQDLNTVFTTRVTRFREQLSAMPVMQFEVLIS